MVINKREIIKQDVFEIQQRIFEDQRYLNTWHSGVEDKWSEWRTFVVKATLPDARRLQIALDHNKPRIKHKVEYRLIIQ